MYEVNDELRQKLYVEITELNKRKDHDYDFAFDKSFDEFGLISPVIRLQDKLNRVKSFVRGGTLQVTDESIEDTLIDLANYTLKTIIAMRRNRQ